VDQIVVVRVVAPFSVATSISEEDFPPSSESGIVCVLERLKYDELDMLVG
jgi:hypothetical protein